jgi:lysophospholipase L1-like esterase
VTFVLGFGDSITAGITSTRCDMGGTLRICGTTVTPYPSRVRALLAAAYPSQSFQSETSGVPGECASVSGCTGQSGRSRLTQTIAPQHELVVILEGINDINSGQPGSQIIAALQAMIQTAKSAGKQVLLCNLTPFRLREDSQMLPTDPAAWAALNAAIDTLAQSEGVGRVNLAAALGTNVNDLISPDGLHPSDAGYQRMAEAVRDKIVERFEITP